MNVYPLPLKFSHNQTESCIYPALLHDGRELLLVDCGYQGFLPRIEEAMQERGFTIGQLTGLIITHHDIDHMAAASELKAACPHLKIYTSAGEAPYVSGQAKSLRLQQAEDLFPSLSEEQRPGALAFQARLQSIRPVVVDYTFEGEGATEFMPDVEIVHTSGHTPGHFSIYVRSQKTMIAADAVVYQGGELDIANRSFTLDVPAAIESLKKMQQFEIDTLICYHGGVLREGIQEKLTRAISRYSGGLVP